jgi:hypothetical protein
LFNVACVNAIPRIYDFSHPCWRHYTKLSKRWVVDAIRRAFASLNIQPLPLSTRVAKRKHVWWFVIQTRSIMLGNTVWKASFAETLCICQGPDSNVNPTLYSTSTKLFQTIRRAVFKLGKTTFNARIHSKSDWVIWAWLDYTNNSLESIERLYINIHYELSFYRTWRVRLYSLKLLVIQNINRFHLQYWITKLFTVRLLWINTYIILLHANQLN